MAAGKEHPRSKEVERLNKEIAVLQQRIAALEVRMKETQRIIEGIKPRDAVLDDDDD
jgi:prefoldin subunit 5